jgi:hypothetical protein
MYDMKDDRQTVLDAVEQHVPIGCKTAQAGE